MRKILIVGAGQSGLQLALGLNKAGYEVTVMTSYTGQEIYDGSVTSTQCMFGQALDLERAIGADLWAEAGHRIDALGVTVAGPDGVPVICFLGNLVQYAQSIDQRVKFSAWLEHFEQAGGEIVVHGATVTDLDKLAQRYDLTIVAAGKGELVSMFDRDPDRSPYTQPQRALALAYVHGMSPRTEHPDTGAVRLSLIPGHGELITIPALTKTGPCDILFWEAIPNGPLDVFTTGTDPADTLEQILQLMHNYAPWEYERCASVELADARATLIGRYAPIVRHPVAQLPSGGLVLGMADVVVANDPITGQGSNNASRFSDAYLKAIIEHADRPFDAAFMQGAFDTAWERVATCTAWTNAMLAPPPPHVLAALGAAGTHQQVADRFANGFSDPDDFAWLLDPGQTALYLAHAQRVGEGAL